jgi:predicted metal-dependent HD superfamily phosphohydrolase
MTKPMIKLVNAETGEEIVREMNATELAQWDKDLAEAQAAKAEAAQKAADKAALLEKLGISESEAALLLS